MSETLETSTPMICADTPNAIGSQESESGPTLCVSPVFQMTLPFGPAPAPVNLSARQAEQQGLLTSGTSGPRGSISSASAALQLSLVNRCRARMPYDGLTLFKMTWKERATPSGRLIHALRASAHRTSGSDCTSWPTPNATGADRGGQAKRADGTRSNLIDTAQLAAWNTPKTSDIFGSRMEDGRRGVGLNSHAAWATPSASDGNGGKGFRPGVTMTGRMPDGSKVTMDLSAQVKLGLSNWATPAARDWRDRRASPETMSRNSRPLNEQAVQLADSGPMPNGSTVETKSGGQLNPAHSRWLIGLPPEWDDCAVMATASLPRSRRSSSRRTSTQGNNVNDS